MLILVKKKKMKKKNLQFLNIYINLKLKEVQSTSRLLYQVYKVLLSNSIDI